MDKKSVTDMLKRISGLLLLAFLVLGLASCLRDAARIPVAGEEASATTADQPAAADTPSASPPSVPREDTQGHHWRRLDVTGGGAQTGIAVHPTDPDVVYMASDNGGLFKTENGGDSWFSVSSNLGAYRLGFVTLDPLNPDVIYVTASTDHGRGTQGGARGEIHRSLNGGLSWEFVSDAMGFQSSIPNQTSMAIPYDPTAPGQFDRDGDGLSDVILVGAWTGPADPPVGGIWRSEDEGRTFTHVALEDRNITALRAFARNVKVLFVATHEGEVYRSQDLGASWGNITGNMPLPSLSDLAVHPTDKDILYVTCRWCQAGEPPVWRTTDGGQNWKAASGGLDSVEVVSFPRILIDRLDSNILYVTTDKASYRMGGVYKSVDGGQSWHLMPDRLVLPDGRPYFWYEFEGEFAIGQAIDGRLFAGGEGAWRYPDGDLNDGREEWEPAAIGIGNIQVNSIEVDPSDPTVLYQGVNDRGPYKSVDRGASFHRILGDGWPVTVDNFVWNGPYYSNYQRCWLPCSRTCDEEGRVASGGTTDFAISRQDSNVVYSALGSGSGKSDYGGVNKSTDGGQTWQPLGFQLEGGFVLDPETCVPYGFRHLAIDPTDDEVLFAAMEIPSADEGKLYRTTDGGATWSEVFATSGYITGIEVSVTDPDLVLLTTYSDVYRSKQGGEAGSWEIIAPPEISRILTAGISPHNPQIYVVGTNDQGIYYTADGGISWRNNQLKDLFEQRLRQGSDQYLDGESATAFNPHEDMLSNISASVFDPVAPDVFYVAGTQRVRGSFGVAKITNAGRNWERLPLEGLAHRNVFDLAVDASGEFIYAGTFDGTYRFRLR